MRPNLSLSEQVFAALRRIIRAIDIHSKKLVERYGLTGPQLHVLQQLAELEEVSVGGLAKRVRLSNATVTDILDRLERRGLVQRTRSISDKRRVLVKVTEDGMHILLAAPPLLQEQFSAEFNRMHDWEQTLIVSTLQRVASMMETESLAPDNGLDETALIEAVKTEPLALEASAVVHEINPESKAS
ncbi:MAG: MarR family transcriptional regulator [bacterium]|nr:MarR family transcriptional regulator [bacterium]